MLRSLIGGAELSFFGTCLALLLPSWATSAEAAPVEGMVVESQSRWGYGHSAIVTESVVEQSDGSRVTLHQLGGSQDGIGMWQSHSPRVLNKGDQVVLDAKQIRTPSGRYLHQVQSIFSLRPANLAEGDKSDGRHDFVRTQNATGVDIFWKSGCAYLSVATEGSSQINGDREFEIVDAVLGHWHDTTRSCSNFTLINEGPDDREVGLDGINLIKFREDFWCRPANGDDPQECYDQAAAGLTTLFFVDDSGSDRNGEIIDADMEFNGVNFALAADGATNGTQDCEADLANTLTHEVGHFLGLDHTCRANGPALLDHLGNPVPECGGAGIGPEITEATMYNFQACGETKKATLESDDIAGMCSIYPAETHTQSCKRANIKPAGCCSVAGAEDSNESSRGTLLLILFGLLALAGTRATLKR